MKTAKCRSAANLPPTLPRRRPAMSATPPPAASANSASAAAKPRNLALDCFRGLALLIIFINHMPSNPLSGLTPSRFGLSDAAEIFVFLSGYAAALAYGPSFRASGLWLGSVRVLLRSGQLYLAHLGIFFAMAAVCVFGNGLPGGRDYIQALSLQHFFDFTPDTLAALFLLRYVPNAFDILPLYCLMLLWVPVVWVASRVHVGAALAFPVALYGSMWWFEMELPADLLSDRPWFFNPFGWQLLFFTGFAFGAGWLKPPPPHRWLLALCALFVLLSIPVGHELKAPPWGELRAALAPLLDKSHLGLLRWLHFMALAYLATALLRDRQHWLRWPACKRLAQMGRHALPIFLLGVLLSNLGGMALDQLGRSPPAVALVNLAGFALMAAAAQAIAWLAAKPWKTPASLEPERQTAECPPQPLRLASQVCLAALLLPLALAPVLMAQQRSNLGDPEATLSANQTDADGDDLYENSGDMAVRLELGDRI